MHLPDPIFPPLIKGHAVNAPTTPFAEACRGAADGRYGAGDLVWARNTARVDMALVLEPDVSAARSRQMLPLMMVATGDCLGALLPPQVPVQYRWPRSLLLNSGVAGRFFFATAPCASDAIPDWLVIGTQIALAEPDRRGEPGEVAAITSVADEGGGDLDRTTVIESLASHLLSWLHAWQEAGWRPAHGVFMGRLEGSDEMASYAACGADGGGQILGRAVGLDDEANLLVKAEDGRVHALSFGATLAERDAPECTGTKLEGNPS